MTVRATTSTSTSTDPEFSRASPRWISNRLQNRRDASVAFDPSPSLGRAAIVPLWVRIALPAAIMGNVALFISSNASVGATVRMYAAVSGSRDRVDFPPLHEFSLGSSVRDMWRAGTYPLSILIAVFSGGWPYLKLAVMLFAWFAPPRDYTRRVEGVCSRSSTRSASGRSWTRSS